MMGYNKNIRIPAEWEQQEFVMLAFPHHKTDWCYMLDEISACYKQIISAILKYESVVLLCSDIEYTKKYIIGENNQIINENKLNNRKIQNFIQNYCSNISLTLIEIDTNDTWVRDFGGITITSFNIIKRKTEKTVLDFGFNGWGLKFPSNLDNLITYKLFANFPCIFENYKYKDYRKMILEGGSIESDGKGTILSTEKCLLSENRNYISRKKLEKKLKKYLGANRILWLKNGYLQGDDTDSHIDTLARFCDENTIAYVQCTDVKDSHYEELKAMELELAKLKNNIGLPYSLIPLPMADKVIFDTERLPATYANFLIINDAVIMPSYNSPKDEIAKQRLKKVFPNRDIIMVDCIPLIKQHGSLHCITMQFPK